MSKRGKIILGTVMIIVGIILVAMGFLRISGFVSNLGDTELIGAGIGIALIFIGVIIAGIGGIIIYLANMRNILSYAAKQTAKGTEEIARSVGRGLSKGMKGQK
jgi:hypothetical protein